MLVAHKTSSYYWDSIDWFLVAESQLREHVAAHVASSQFLTAAPIPPFLSRFLVPITTEELSPTPPPCLSISRASSPAAIQATLLSLLSKFGFFSQLNSQLELKAVVVVLYYTQSLLSTSMLLQPCGSRGSTDCHASRRKGKSSAHRRRLRSYT